MQLSKIVPPEWKDRNGHVNVQFYQKLYELGGYQVLEEVGIGESYLQAHNFGMFDLEHHLHYRSELLIGAAVNTYNRILNRNDKRFHGMYFIVDASRDELAGTLEYITSGVDLRTRRMCPFPDKLSRGIEKQLGKHRLLDWAAPVCGVMGV